MQEKKIGVGDYVEYIPDLEKCLVSAEHSGCCKEQAFYPSLRKLWRVFKVGECVELISAKSVGNLVLSGFYGYLNSDRLLDYVADSFVNPQYAISGRCLGSGRTVFPTTKWITCYNEDSAKIETVAHDSVSDAEYLCLHDLLPKRGMFWCAERYEDKEESDIYLGCRCMNGEDGDVYGVCFQHEECGEIAKLYSHKKGILVIVRLKDDVDFMDGEGTLGSPWKLK